MKGTKKNMLYTERCVCSRGHAVGNAFKIHNATTSTCSAQVPSTNNNVGALQERRKRMPRCVTFSQHRVYVLWMGNINDVVC